MSSSSSSSAASSSSASAVGAVVETRIEDICVLVDYHERDLLRNSFPFLDRPFPYCVVNCAVADVIVCVKKPAPPGAQLANAQTGDGQLFATPAPVAHNETCAALRGSADAALPEPFTPESTVYEPLFAVERKAVPDLTNSIRGRGGNGSALNRFKDQKLRLLAFCAETGAKPYLLVEGLQKYDPQKLVEGMPFEAVHTALTNTCARDGISVQHEGNVHMTGRWVNKLCKCAVKHQLRPGARGGGAARLVAGKNSLQDHAQAVSVRKSDNFTPQLGFRTWLMTARGMSSEKAGAIMEKHGTIADLVRHYQDKKKAFLARMTPKKAERECELLLQNIEITGGGRTANGHFRKIGPALSKAVYVRLFTAAPEKSEEAANAGEVAEAKPKTSAAEKKWKRTQQDSPFLSVSLPPSRSDSGGARKGKKRKSSVEEGPLQQEEEGGQDFASRFARKLE